MNVPEATTGVPITSPAVFSGPPKADNSAPPPITNPTLPTKKEGIRLSDIVLGILYLVFTGYAIFYGWMYGQQIGRDYLLYIQSWGLWFRSWFIRPTPVV
jgi:hypothetical protein